MFGKTKETNDIVEQTDLDVTIDDFFGDETAVAEAVRVDHLHQRVTQVEQQISSQFTSLAAYAQIAQEQVELVRSEAQHTNERGEQRVVGLIERERADRIGATTGGGIDVTPRLDALDAQVAEIRDGLQQCLSNQKALADAITDLFASERIVTAPEAAPAPKITPSALSSMPAPLSVAPSTSSQQETLPPPPPNPSSLADLDQELEELGVNMSNDVDDLVAIAPHEAETELINGPIDGLSLN
jgi:hypothetical protein